jgi:hypothetical protein
MPAPVNDTKALLDRRLDEIGWGCFLLTMGGLLLVPEDMLPRGVWLIAIGAILLGINAVRYTSQIKISGFTAALGLFTLVAGVSAVAGVQLPLFAIFLILVGASVLFRPLFHHPASP